MTKYGVRLLIEDLTDEVEAKSSEEAEFLAFAKARKENPNLVIYDIQVEEIK